MKKQRLLSFLLALVLILGTTLPSIARAVPVQNIVQENLESDFEFDKANQTITGYKGQDKEIVIPAEIDGVKVKKIGPGVFSQKDITKVSLPEGLVEIGQGAFSGTKLEELVLPESLEIIGGSAFHSVEGIKELILPTNLKEIGSRAFWKCGISELKVPANVKKVSSDAFIDNKIGILILEEGIEDIGRRAFKDNKIKEAVIPASLEKAGSNIFEGNGSIEISYPIIDRILEEKSNLNLDKYPEDLKEAYLLSVDKIKNLRNIEPSDFLKEKKAYDEAKKALDLFDKEAINSDFEFDKESQTITGYKGEEKNLVIPGKIDGVQVKKIGNGAFARKGLESLVLPEGLEEIENQMAFAANNLKELRLPKSLKTLGAGAFVNNPDLENVELNEGLEIIGNNAFARCNLEKVFIPSTVKEIGTRAFNKSNVKELDFAENSQIELIDNAAFEDNKLEKLVLPESIKEVQNIAFNRNNLSELTILGSSLERIGAQAFGGNKLTEIELPLELKIIVFHSFRDNPGVDGKLIINLNKKLIASSEEKALDLIREKVKLRAYCESVMSEPKEWSNIIWAKEKEENNEIVYRGEFEEFQEQTAGNEYISKVNVRVRVELEEEESDFIFDKVSQTITGYKGEEKNLVIPEKIDGVEVKKIGNMAFARKKLTSVEIPSTVKKIETGAFLGNPDLASLTLNEGLDTIGDMAFTKAKLKEVTIPGSVRRIGKKSFMDNGMEKLIFKEGRLSVISNEAFKNNKLKELTLPESLRLIDNAAFQDNLLENIEIKGDNLIKIGSQSFGGNQLKEVEIPNTLKTILFHSFKDNPGVDGKVVIKFRDKVEIESIDELEEKIILKAYCQSVGSQDPEAVGIEWSKVNDNLLEGRFKEFQHQTAGNADIKNLVLKLEVKIEEEKSDFEFDKESQTITGYKGEEKDLVIPEKIDGVEVKKIGKMAFARKKLTSVEIPSTVKKIETGAFLGNPDLAKLTLNEGLDTIESMAFTKAKLKEVEIPGSVRKIGEKAFMNNGIEKLVLKKGRLSVISNEAFKDNKLKELTLPESVRMIDNAAFQNNLLENIEIKGDKLIKIGSQSFGGNQLKEVEIPNTLKTILFHSFKNNPGIDGKVVLKFRDKVEIGSIDELEEKIILKAYCQSVMSQDPEAVGIEWSKVNDNLLEGKFKEFQEQTAGNEDIKNLVLILEIENPVEDSGKIDGVVVNKGDKEIYLPLAKYMRMIAIDDGNKAFFKNEKGSIELSKLVSQDKFIDIKDYNENFKKTKNISKAIKASKALDLEDIEDLYKVLGKIKGADTRLVPLFSSEEWTEADFEIEDGVLKGLSSYGKDKIKDNKNLVIPEGVKVVEAGVFARQGIETIEFNRDIEEVKFNSFMGNNIKKLNIPASMKKIGKSAFSSSQIEEIIFEEGIEEIAEYAFANNNIHSLELPSSLRTLKEKAFYQSNIHEVIFNDGLELIGNQSFEDNKIEKLILPKTLKAIDVGAFVYNNIKEVDFPYGIKIIGPKAFGVNNMDSVKIPETVEWICPNAFRKNPGFEKEEFKIYIDQDIILNKEIEGNEILDFLNDRVEVRAAVFEDLISKTKHPVDLIDWQVIKEEEDLLTFRGKFDRLPEDKLNCGFGTSCEDVVSNMEKISLIVEVKLGEKAIVSEGKTDRKNLDKLLEEAKALNPAEYTEESFKDIIYGINYPDTYQRQVDRKIEILEHALENLEALKEDKDDTEWTVEDFNYEGDTLLGFSDKGLVKFEKSKFISFPEKTSSGENLRKIGDGAFNLDPNADESEQIRGIKLPVTLEEIGNMAFRNNNIKDLDLSNVSLLGNGAFARNLNLSSVELSKDLKIIPNGCFSFSNLTEVDIPEGVEVIGGSAFNESNKLEKISLPSTLKEIEARAFTNINAFSLTIPGNVEKIGMEAFSGGKLSELVLEEGIKEIGKRAFKRNKIGNIVIPASVKKLSSDAFDAMPSVNIQYRILLDLKADLKEMEETDEVKSYISKIDQLNTGKKGRLDEALDLYKEIKAETEKSLDLAA